MSYRIGGACLLLVACGTHSSPVPDGVGTPAPGATGTETNGETTTAATGTAATPSPNESMPSPDVSPRDTDENGVVVAGGETYDFGSGVTVPSGCGFAEPEDLSADTARSTLPEASVALALFDREWSAPFQWGDPDCPASDLTPGEETTLSMSTKLLSVRHYRSSPDPDAPAGTLCEDRYYYRAVVALDTADGGIAGTFYAEFQGTRTSASASAVPNALNFRGSLAFPRDSSRPHLAGVLVRINLEEEGTSGSLDVAVNHTDDVNVGSEYIIGTNGDVTIVVESGVYCQRDGSGRLGANGSWRSDGMEVVSEQCALEPPCETLPDVVTLDAFDGSTEVPTCFVEVDAYNRDLSDGYASGGLAEVFFDGELTTATPAAPEGAGGSPGYENWGVPHQLGRVAFGTHVELVVHSPNESTVSTANIRVDLMPSGGTRASCEEPGCTAQAELVVNGYCAH